MFETIGMIWTITVGSRHFEPHRETKIGSRIVTSNCAKIAEMFCYHDHVTHFQRKKYGQTKVVVNAHMDEIINVVPVKGSNYFGVQDFYEKLSKNYDALQTLEEGEKLQGFVMTTLNKLPHVKPDPVRVNESWEEWSMEDLIDALQKWLRRNHVENSKCEKHLFTQRPGDNQSPYCLFCRKHDHWSENCTVVTALANRKKFFVDHNLCFNCGRSNHSRAVP